MRVGLQYLRQSPRLQVTMVRIALFMLQVSGLMSLLPLLAKQMPGGGAGTFSALLAATGVGAVGMVVFMGRVRDVLGRDRAVITGSLLHAASAAGAALAPNVWLAMPCLVVAGACVILTANTITVAAQLTLPDWVRARGMAVYQMALMGGAAAGAAIWGYVAGGFDVRPTVLASAGFGALAALFTLRLSIERVNPDDQRPAQIAALPLPAISIDADDGPVMVTVEYQIDPARAPEFAEVMQLTRRARLRQGALSWGLFRDAMVPGRYVEYFVDESWLEHQRRLERFTAGDAGLRELRLSFHIGGQPPAVRRLVGEPMLE
jgi:MFS family permease